VRRFSTQQSWVCSRRKQQQQIFQQQLQNNNNSRNRHAAAAAGNSSRHTRSCSSNSNNFTSRPCTSSLPSHRMPPRYHISVAPPPRRHDHLVVVAANSAGTLSQGLESPSPFCRRTSCFPLPLRWSRNLSRLRTE
jgi:hypothetical protein